MEELKMHECPRFVKEVSSILKILPIFKYLSFGYISIMGHIRYTNFNTVFNEQTYQSTVIWLRIIYRQVSHIQTTAITVAGEAFAVTVPVRTKCGQSADKV